MLWVCPVCRQPLVEQGRQLHCDSGHSFDRAREGYVNLLLAQGRRSRQPGDDRDMLRNRREFLERDYYRPLAARLAQLCADRVRASSQAVFSLLDVGCGEGYYTGIVAQAVSGVRDAQCLRLGGVDIAREAVRMASRRYPGVDFAVASNAALPVGDQALDLVLQVFAPGYPAEIARVLNKEGSYVRVTPGPRHLFALRGLVYDQPQEHGLDDDALAGMKRIDRQLLADRIVIEGDGDVGRLFSMTPYYWQASRKKQADILALDRLETEIEFCVDVFSPD